MCSGGDASSFAVGSVRTLLLRTSSVLRCQVCLALGYSFGNIRVVQSLQGSLFASGGAGDKAGNAVTAFALVVAVVLVI